MRIIFTTGHYKPEQSAESALHERRAFRYFAEALQALGHEVCVICPFGEDAEIVQNGVVYRFVAASRLWRLAGTAFAPAARSFGRSYAELATRMIPLFDDFAPDVVHFSGLTLDPNLWLVSRWAQRRGVPLVVQYHGGAAARNPLRRRLQRHNIARAGRVLFSVSGQADSWGKQLDGKVIEFMEMSSRFRPKPRPLARQETTIHGDPVLVWAGRLHPLKDPLTILRGMVRLLEHFPNIKLYIFYLNAPMLNEVEAFITQNGLQNAVEIRGRVPQESLEAVFSGADFFVQGSLREISGLSVLEAMACGAIPIVTDIPTLAAMTKGGRFGRIFPIGDDKAFADHILAITDRERLSQEVAAHFAENFSYEALARKLDDIYRTVQKERTQP